MAKRRHHTSIYIAYVDMFAAVLSFVFFSLTVHKNDASNVAVNAEYIVTAEWSNTIDADVDLWAETPRGNLVFYHNRAADLLTLDQDCLGFSSSMILLPDGRSVKAASFKETDTLRGNIPGDYTFGVYMFNYHVGGQTINSEADPRDLNTPVHMEIWKLNPIAHMVFSKDTTLHRLHDGGNLVTMTVNADPTADPVFKTPPLERIMDKFYGSSEKTKAN